MSQIFLHKYMHRRFQVHLFMLIGAQKQKNVQECLPPTTVSAWEATVKVNEELYIIGPANDIEKLEKEKVDLVAEVDEWKGNYRWMAGERDKLLIKDKPITNP